MMFCLLKELLYYITVPWDQVHFSEKNCKAFTSKVLGNTHPESVVTVSLPRLHALFGCIRTLNQTFTMLLDCVSFVALKTNTVLPAQYPLKSDIEEESFFWRAGCKMAVWTSRGGPFKSMLSMSDTFAVLMSHLIPVIHFGIAVLVPHTVTTCWAVARLNNCLSCLCIC